MLAKVKSGALLGVDAYIVEVEVDLAPGLPAFTTVGLPETAVKESKDRVRAAVKNSGYKFPGNRITINLAPADIRKEGTGFDLPVAVGILAAQGLLPPAAADAYLLYGELSLDGRLKPTRGVLSMALATRAANLALIIPRANAREAGVVQGINIYPAERLSQVMEFLSGREPLSALTPEPPALVASPPAYERGFPGRPGPGAGETGPAHCRRRQPQRPDGGSARRRQDHAGPEPAHGAAAVELRRGPGDLQDLQHHGAPETRPGPGAPAPFPVAAPHHLGRRAHRRRHHPPARGGEPGPPRGALPGRAAGVPALHPGGAAAAPGRGQGHHLPGGHLADLPGPVHAGGGHEPLPLRLPGRPQAGLHLHPQPGHLLSLPHLRAAAGPDRHPGPGAGGAVSGYDGARRPGEGSVELRARVIAAREVQSRRFHKTRIYANAHMPAKLVKQHCAPGPEAQRLLEVAMERLGLSARAYHRILKIARTIADLEGEGAITPAHVAEAIQYRTMDRKFG